MADVTVSTPGKLILMGEHAAVYGRPALVAAVDLRLTARLSPGTLPGVRLELPDLGPGFGKTEQISWQELLDYARRTRLLWDDYSREPGPDGFRRVRGEDPAHVVKVALGEAAESLGEITGLGGPPLTLHVSSQLPIGSGFGSSAATAVAVIAGYRLFRGAPADPETVERLALEVERRQHGMPSGVDGATVVHGGVLWVCRLPEGGLEREPVTVRSPLLSRLRVYDTGTPPEPTGAVVAAVRSRRDRDPARFEALLDRMAAAARGLRAELARELEDPTEVIHLLSEQEKCLEELGAVPAAVRDVVRQIEAAGGAAKISGAGSLAGPGAGSLLVYHSAPERIAAWELLRPFRFHPVRLGAPGFRREG